MAAKRGARGSWLGLLMGWIITNSYGEYKGEFDVGGEKFLRGKSLARGSFEFRIRSKELCHG
jgi:hypothetical protein